MKCRNIVFLQGEEADDALEILNEKGEEAALDYLKEWDFPGEGEIYEGKPWGTSDRTYREDNYILSYNLPLNYIGLCEVVEDDEIPFESNPLVKNTKYNDEDLENVKKVIYHHLTNGKHIKLRESYSYEDFLNAGPVHFDQKGFKFPISPSRFIGGYDKKKISAHRYGPSKNFYKLFTKIEKDIQKDLIKNHKIAKSVAEKVHVGAVKWAGPIMVVASIPKQYFPHIEYTDEYEGEI